MPQMNPARRSAMLTQILKDLQEQSKFKGNRSGGEVAARLGALWIQKQQADKLQEQENAQRNRDGANAANIANIAMGGPGLDFMGRPQPTPEGEDGEPKPQADQLTEAISQQLRQNPEDPMAIAMLNEQLKRQQVEQTRADQGLFGPSLQGRAMSIVSETVEGDRDSDDISFRMARDYLEKPRTVTTPDATYVIQGMDVDSLFKSPQGSPAQAQAGREQDAIPGKTMKQPTERERMMAFSAKNMFANHNSMQKLQEQFPDFDPTNLAEARGLLPFGMGEVLGSSEYLQYKDRGKQFIADAVFVRSGSQINEQELELAWQSMYPQPGNPIGSVYSKTSNRMQFVESALIAGERALRREVGDSTYENWLSRTQQERARFESTLTLINDLKQEFNLNEEEQRTVAKLKEQGMSEEQIRSMLE